jgi:hypothetical protein
MTRRKPRPADPAQLYPERLEALIAAVWVDAMAGDRQAVEVCRRVLAQQAKFYGLDADAGPVPPITDQQLAPDDDELASYRARYQRKDA